MASLFRQLLVLLALAALACAAPQQKPGKNPNDKRRGNAGMDVATMISFDRLMASGCLPEDFRAPNISDCVVSGNVQATLQCINSRMQEAGGDEAFLSTMSDDGVWVEAQASLLSDCDSMAHNLTATQLQVFRIACWRRVAEFECRKQVLENIGEQAANETGRYIGSRFAYLLDSGCLHEGMDYGKEVKATYMRCAEENDLSWEELGGTAAHLANITAGVAGEQLQSVAEVEFTEAEVLGAGTKLEKLNATIFCAMQAAGEVTADGAVDQTAIHRNLDAAKGPEWLKGVNAFVSDMCVGQGYNTYFPYIICWFNSAPYACASIDAHTMARGKGMGKGRKGKRPGRRQRQKGRNGRRRNGRMCRRRQG